LNLPVFDIKISLPEDWGRGFCFVYTSNICGNISTINILA
jgi:hypothetical protein